MTAASAASAPAAPRLVVVAAVPGLTWADVARMPAARALSAVSAIGSMADKPVANTASCAAGSLQVDAGTRVVTLSSSCDVNESPLLATKNHSDDYSADIYALGDSLHRGGVRVVAVGADAGVLVARDGGVVDRIGSSLASELRRVTPSAATVIATLDPILSRSPADGETLSQLDAWIGNVTNRVPSSARLILAGTSDAATGGAHLHVVMMRAPGLPHRALTSTTTGRASFVESVDIAPTVLTNFGLPVPSSMIGHAMTASSQAASSVSSLADDDVHAVQGLIAAIVVRLIIMVIASLALIFIVVGWRDAAIVFARVATPLPLLAWLSQLVPWWRHGVPVLVAGLLIAAMAYALVMTRQRERGGLSPLFELTAVPGVTVLLLLVDQLTGAALQLSAPLGDDPLEAGRFTGVGNTDFAVLLGAGLFCLAVFGARMSRTAGLTVAAIGSLVLIGVDGAPSIGDDLGGVLSAVPAAAVMLALLAGKKLRLGRLFAIAAVAVAAAFGAAALDYARPAADQTHLGHFFGQLLHGGAMTTIRRKLTTVVKLQGELPLLAVIAARFAPERWRDACSDWLTSPDVPGLIPGLIAVAVAGTLGSLLNDSGLSIAVLAAYSVLPAVIAATAA